MMGRVCLALREVRARANRETEPAVAFSETPSLPAHSFAHRPTTTAPPFCGMNW